ncbi:HAD hydrolase family protein [Anaeromicrobium sediminis]|uniref:Uncharacterized protein n=1 Tax=Anaeromicrobium sediminis TaxID=1478221 RepID=A0A267MJL3_9FIRM|nr:HAD hydrolase family protein [Anaeromicrobium sediminis]PAB59065.1 hypothetical protein CCE28_12520 [Anaeromicrobium sediminis]
MIEFAGLGIAMENGVEKVKKVANFTTDTNGEDGLAKALNKFILDEYEDLEMKEVI